MECTAHLCRKCCNLLFSLNFQHVGHKSTCDIEPSILDASLCFYWSYAVSAGVRRRTSQAVEAENLVEAVDQSGGGGGEPGGGGGPVRRWGRWEVE